MMQLPRFTLRDGHTIPVIGFGTGTGMFIKKPGDGDTVDRKMVEVLKGAISKGFVHLDTAEVYGTEREVGAAVRESDVPRQDIFVTTKVRESWENVEAAVQRSLDRLRMDYIDLYLIHSPRVFPTEEAMQRTWLALVEAKRSGKVRSIGVSNMTDKQVETIMDACTELPAVNQIPFNPYKQHCGRSKHPVTDMGDLDWMQAQGILVQAWRPLAPLTVRRGYALDAPLREMARAHGGVAAESAVLLRWAVQSGVLPVTTAATLERMDEYLGFMGFELSQSEVKTITDVGLTDQY